MTEDRWGAKVEGGAAMLRPGKAGSMPGKARGLHKHHAASQQAAGQQPLSAAQQLGTQRAGRGRGRAEFGHGTGMKVEEGSPVLLRDTRTRHCSGSTSVLRRCTRHCQSARLHWQAPLTQHNADDTAWQPSSGQTAGGTCLRSAAGAPQVVCGAGGSARENLDKRTLPLMRARPLTPHLEKINSC